MAKFKPKRRRTRRWAKLRRYKPKRIPLLPTIGFIAPALTAKPDGWSSPLEAMQNGRFDLAMQTAVRNITGMKLPMGGQQGFSWDVWQTLNPFNLDEAPALKGLFWGGIASMALGALGLKRKFNSATAKIPLLKKVTL